MVNKPHYKLVSFDIWQTLLKSNPAFVEARGILFSQELGHSDLKHLKSVKDEVDLEHDHLAESTGKDSDFNTRMIAMIEKLQKKLGDYPQNFLENTRNKLADLFVAHLPHFINEKTIDIFKELKKRNIKIALLSNTGFLHGDTMRPALKAIGVSDYVDFALFSNEIGFAKPHPDIFKELLRQSGFLGQEILHIGDSVKADYTGAWEAGITSVLFDPTNKHGNRMFSISSTNDLLKIVDNELPVLHYDNLSLYSLHMNKESIVDQENKPFDFVEYSKFKYGDGKVAKGYGYKLAQKFIEMYPNIFKTENDEINIVITTSPYKAIAKGSSGIVRGFKNYINQHLLSSGKSAVVDIVILKKEMFQGDYGSFTDQQRKELMHKNDLYVMEKFITGKKLILIDDARITGSHEANLVSFLIDKQIEEAYFLYIADMEIEFAKEHPDIENIMNHGWVDNLDKLYTIMKSPEFILNARVCKYILSKNKQDQLTSFLKRLDDHILYDLYNGIVGDGYASMALYSDSFAILRQELVDRSLMKNGNF